jgi:hypothetical protein
MLTFATSVQTYFYQTWSVTCHNSDKPIWNGQSSLNKFREKGSKRSISVISRSVHWSMDWIAPLCHVRSWHKAREKKNDIRQVSEKVVVRHLPSGTYRNWYGITVYKLQPTAGAYLPWYQEYAKHWGPQLQVGHEPSATLFLHSQNTANYSGGFGWIQAYSREINFARIRFSVANWGIIVYTYYVWLQSRDLISYFMRPCFVTQFVDFTLLGDFLACHQFITKRPKNLKCHNYGKSSVILIFGNTVVRW